MTLISFVYIYDICALIPYQGQGQMSMSRSLPSKIVKTLPVLTKCFHFLIRFEVKLIIQGIPVKI